MITIFKYPLQIGSQTTVTFSAGPEQDIPDVLHVVMQGDQVMLWAKVEKFGQWAVTRKFQVVGTGWAVHPSWRYIGSVQEQVGDEEYVWHVFEDLS